MPFLGIASPKWEYQMGIFYEVFCPKNNNNKKSPQSSNSFRNYHSSNYRITMTPLSINIFNMQLMLLVTHKAADIKLEMQSSVIRQCIEMNIRFRIWVIRQTREWKPCRKRQVTLKQNWTGHSLWKFFQKTNKTFSMREQMAFKWEMT